MQIWQGATGREDHPKAQPRDSVVTVWLLLSGRSSAGFIFPSPFIESDVKPFGLLRPVPVGVVPALPWITFVLCTRRDSIRAERATRAPFRTGLKPSAVWKPAVPQEGVKPRECWSVSCFCYDFCPVTQYHLRTSPSLGQLCQQGMGCCCRWSCRQSQLRNPSGGFNELQV